VQAILLLWAFMAAAWAAFQSQRGANIAYNAYVSANRPIVELKDMMALSSRHPGIVGSQKASRIAFTLINRGGIPAKVIRSYIEIRFSDTPIPSEFIYSDEYRFPLKFSVDNYIIEAGGRHTIEFDISSTIAPPTQGATVTDSTHYPISALGEVNSTSVLSKAGAPQDLYVLGWIRFEDEVGVTRQIGFCRRRVQNASSCEPLEGSNLEYSAGES
jgi:hypothetical protein